MQIMKDITTVRETYTRITVGKDAKDRPVFNVWLIVGEQHFCTTPAPYDNREEAVWFQEQLAVALSRIVKEQQHENKVKTVR